MYAMNCTLHELVCCKVRCCCCWQCLIGFMHLSVWIIWFDVGIVVRAVLVNLLCLSSFFFFFCLICYLPCQWTVHATCRQHRKSQPPQHGYLHRQVHQVVHLPSSHHCTRPPCSIRQGMMATLGVSAAAAACFLFPQSLSQLSCSLQLSS